MKRNSVVPETKPPSEEEFRANMLVGLARAELAAGGPGSLADKMGYKDPRGLAKVRHEGSFPCPYKLFNALFACPNALREVAALYGFKMIPTGTVHASVGEDLRLAIGKVDLWLDESMHSGSDEQENISRDELLKGEGALMAAEHEIHVMLAHVRSAKDHKLRLVRGHGSGQ
jgi:hypothetical protein